MTEKNPILALSEQFEALQGDNVVLREELDLVNNQIQALRMEDIGWQRLYGETDSEDGLSMETLKNTSKMLKEHVAGSPLPKQANALRFSYTFGQPFVIEGVDRNDPEVTGPGAPNKSVRTKKVLREFVDSEAAQAHLFGIEGQWAMSTACSTDSTYLLIGDDKTYDLKPIPVSQIVTHMIDPEYPGVIQAYLREWNSTAPDGTKKLNRLWYYVDKFTGTRQKTLPGISDTSGERIPVAQGKTLFDLVVGRQVGWTVGIPDLMAGMVWNRNFITMMNHGKEVSELLATYAAKVKKKSKTSAQNTGVTISKNDGVAKTIGYSEGNELDVFGTAGKTYDFEGLRPVASMYASSVGVSVVDLLASPSAAGSSYGSASALAPGMRRDIETRRKLIASFMERVLKWRVGEKVSVTPAIIDEIDPYRRAQILMLAINSGLVWPDEARPEVMRMASLSTKHDKEPTGYLIPNNEKSLPRKDIDTDSKTPPGTSAPGQGQSTGDGGAGSTMANDTRDDLVSN